MKHHDREHTEDRQHAENGSEQAIQYVSFSLVPLDLI
jgi:hypothetical protein